MSKKVNTTAIGLFIVTGVTLGVAGLLIFSSSKFFSKTREIIVYFDDSLNGLNEGAPVKFRGVTIGTLRFRKKKNCCYQCRERQECCGKSRDGITVRA